MFIVESLGTIDSKKKGQILNGSCAFATNNLGWIVGVAQFSKYYNFRPFLWRPGMTFMHDLGLPPGESYGLAGSNQRQRTGTHPGLFKPAKYLCVVNEPGLHIY